MRRLNLPLSQDIDVPPEFQECCYYLGNLYAQALGSDPTDVATLGRVVLLLELFFQNENIPAEKKFETAFKVELLFVEIFMKAKFKTRVKSAARRTFVYLSMKLFREHVKSIKFRRMYTEAAVFQLNFSIYVWEKLGLKMGKGDRGSKIKLEGKEERFNINENALAKSVSDSIMKDVEKEFRKSNTLRPTMLWRDEPRKIPATGIAPLRINKNVARLQSKVDQMGKHMGADRSLVPFKPTFTEPEDAEEADDAAQFSEDDSSDDSADETPLGQDQASADNTTEDDAVEIPDVPEAAEFIEIESVDDARPSSSKNEKNVDQRPLADPTQTKNPTETPNDMEHRVTASANHFQNQEATDLDKENLAPQTTDEPENAPWIRKRTLPQHPAQSCSSKRQRIDPRPEIKKLRKRLTELRTQTYSPAFQNPTRTNLRLTRQRFLKIRKILDPFLEICQKLRDICPENTLPRRLALIFAPHNSSFVRMVNCFMSVLGRLDTLEKYAVRRGFTLEYHEVYALLGTHQVFEASGQIFLNLSEFLRECIFDLLVFLDPKSPSTSAGKSPPQIPGYLIDYYEFVYNVLQPTKQGLTRVFYSHRTAEEKYRDAKAVVERELSEAVVEDDDNV